MNALLVYTGSQRDTTRSVALRHDYMEFGSFGIETSSPDAQKVELKLPRYSGTLFTLTRQLGQFHIETYAAGIRLGKAELPPGERTPIAAGDILLLDGLRVEFRAAQPAAMPAVPAADRFATWRALQDEVHRRLRDDLGLDQGADRFDTTLPANRRRIETALQAIVEDTVHRAQEPALEELLLLAVRRGITRVLALGAATGDDMPDGRSSIARIADDFAQEVLKRSAIARQTLDSAEAVQAAFDTLDTEIPGLVAGLRYLLSPRDRIAIAAEVLTRNILDLIFGLGPLSDLIAMQNVSEIMVARYDRIYIEKKGRLEPYIYTFSREQDLRNVIERMLAPTGRVLTQSSAMVDFESDGSRINAVGPPLAVRGRVLTIRKFPRTDRPTLATLAGWGAISPPVARFLDACVRARKNMLISGGTGSGKTTLLNALGRCIGRAERVITVEDTAELDLGDLHVVSLQGRPSVMKDQAPVTIRDLVRNALRMRPDRIVVGECRGGETLDMLQAMNTGHSGSMTTAHANSPRDMLLRLETMVMQGDVSLPVSAIRQQIVAAIDVIVQLNRVRGGHRRVTEVAEVVGIHPHTGEIVVEPVFTWLDGAPDAPGGGRHMFTGFMPSFVPELLAVAGGNGAPLDLFV